MKNKIPYLLTVCICGCLSMFGQTDSAKTMKQLDASADDYIPLLNGSGYEAFTFDISSLSDGQYYNRFCGEKEIDPDMTSKILKYIPHYYIIGIEVNPMKML